MAAATRRQMRIADLKPYAKNPRRGNVEAIKESLQEFGQIKPITVRQQTNEVLAGNHTRIAAQELGWVSIDTYVVDVPDDDVAARIVLADNRTSDLAGYDDAALAELLREVGSFDGTGFSATDYAELLASTTPIVAPDEEVAPPPAKPKTKLGDRIILGEHVLVCGDSTEPEVAKKLLGADEIDMIWTDPPYGVDVHEIANQRADRDWTAMAGDGVNSEEELEALIYLALVQANEHAVPGAAIYVAHADQMREPVKNGLLRAGFSHRQTLVWVKNTLVIGRQDYQWKHEPILYGWKTGTHRWYGVFDKTTVFDNYVGKGNLEDLERGELEDLVRKLMDEPGTVVRIDKPSRSVDHPTMKPVELVAAQISCSCPAGGIVYDPFGGSGSTLIAAEQLGRRARLIELEPAYCDVIVDRWQSLTNKKARRPK